jgi:hypothetical protein
VLWLPVGLGLHRMKGDEFSVPEMPYRLDDSLLTLASCAATRSQPRNHERERDRGQVDRYEARIGTVTPPTLRRRTVPVSMSAHARSVGPAEPPGARRPERVLGCDRVPSLGYSFNTTRQRLVATEPVVRVQRHTRCCDRAVVRSLAICPVTARRRVFQRQPPHGRRSDNDNGVVKRFGRRTRSRNRRT